MGSLKCEMEVLIEGWVPRCLRLSPKTAGTAADDISVNSLIVLAVKA